MANTSALIEVTRGQCMASSVWESVSDGSHPTEHLLIFWSCHQMREYSWEGWCSSLQNRSADLGNLCQTELKLFKVQGFICHILKFLNAAQWNAGVAYSREDLLNTNNSPKMYEYTSFSVCLHKCYKLPNWVLTLRSEYMWQMYSRRAPFIRLVLMSTFILPK